MDDQPKKRGRPKRSDDENRSAWLPAMRVHQDVKDKLIGKANRAGLGQKLTEYRLNCYLDLPPDPVDGMPVDDVVKNLADISRIRQSQTWDEVLTYLDRITQRHMAVIKPDKT